MKFRHSFSRYVAVRRDFCQNIHIIINWSLFLSLSLPAVHYPCISLLLPAVSLLLFPFLPRSCTPPLRSESRGEDGGGPAARLTVLGASYTFTPVCAFFRERTCPFHVPLERARYIYLPFIKYVYTNDQQTDIVDLIVSGASRYFQDSWVELRARSPIAVDSFRDRSPFIRSFISTYERQVQARQWYGTTDQRQAVQIRRIPLGFPFARRQGFWHTAHRTKGESIWIVYLIPYFMMGLYVS